MYNRDMNDRIPETRPATHISVSVTGERLNLSNAGFSERMNSRRVSDPIRRSRLIGARCNQAKHMSRFMW
jgi:hypothetical protein